ncbi:MAG: RNA polymerase sigma factor [Syntrophothermus sp.]
MSRETFSAIFDLHAPALYKYAFLLYNSAMIADQMVGDIFARLSEDMLDGRVKGIHLRCHLYQIAYHLFVGEMHFSERLTPVDGIGLKAGRGAFVDPLSEDRVDFEIVQQALRYDLTSDQRHVVILRFIAGFSVKETAVIMSKKVNHIKVIQNRAMAALRGALGNQGMETRTLTQLIMRMAQG